MYCGYFDILIPHERAITLVFWHHQQWLVEDAPCLVVSNLHWQWPTPFEKRRLRQISAYNVSTVRDSEKSSAMTNRKSTTGFPTSCRWSAYVTPRSSKGWLKRFLIKFNFNRIKSASKFLCENLQRQSCSITNPPSNDPRILARKVTLVPFNLKFSVKVTQLTPVLEHASRGFSALPYLSYLFLKLTYISNKQTNSHRANCKNPHCYMAPIRF